MREDSLSAELIPRNLKTHFTGQRVIYLPRVTSTMEVARREAERGAPEGTIVTAGEQMAGRGRLQRAWLSPQGSVALSLILRPGTVQLPYLIMVVSLAVAYSIEAVTGLKPVIKWPNDVLINDKKVCGILIENKVRGSTVQYAITGIGVNVNLKMTDFPEFQPIATSLSDELCRNVSRLNLVRALLVEIERLYLSLPGSVYEEWRDRLVTLGKRVSVRWGDTLYEGVAESVERDGCLFVRQADGNLVKVVAGDASLRS